VADEQKSPHSGSVGQNQTNVNGTKPDGFGACWHVHWHIARHSLPGKEGSRSPQDGCENGPKRCGMFGNLLHLQDIERCVAAGFNRASEQEAI
jgi:hypothetical protein